MRRILITGVSGFIGRKLCVRMVREGWQVRGTFRSAKKLLDFPSDVEIVQVESIGLKTDWSDALVGVDTIVHLAARVHAINDKSLGALAQFRHVNVTGTERLAREAAERGCRRIVFMSSVKVNGEERNQPYNELDIPEPSDPYAISKWEAEQILRKVAETTNLEVTILRPPLVYGHGVKANFLRLIKTVEQRLPLPLASVNNRRSMIYLENLIDAVVSCIKHPKAIGQTYMVSDGEDISTPELIRRMGLALGRPARLFPFPLFILKAMAKVTGNSETINRLLGSLTIDRSKISQDLEWNAPYTLTQGLEQTARWYLNKI